MRIMRVVLACVMTATAATASPARAAVPDTPSICPMMIQSFSQYGAVYLATFTAEAQTPYDASVTLFSDTTAYELTFKNVLPGKLTFEVPHGDHINYASMDTAGKAGEAATSCASFIIARTLAQQGAPARVPHFRATERAPLPPLTCGTLLQEGSMIEGSAPPMYAPVKSADAVVKIYIDSDGHAFAPSILKSSGDASIDAAAIQSARASKYRPRQFLCSPVIGVYSFRFHYRQRP